MVMDGENCRVTYLYLHLPAKLVRFFVLRSGHVKTAHVGSPVTDALASPGCTPHPVSRREPSLGAYVIFCPHFQC